MNLEKVVDLRNARSDDYRKVLEEIAAKGKCPFCPENFKWHKEPVLLRYKGWFITNAAWPYENAKRHFLIISEKHKEGLGELSDADLRVVLVLVNWAVEGFGIKGGGLALRFGDTTYTGATVCHLHFHLIVPELGPDGKALVVNFPTG